MSDWTHVVGVVVLDTYNFNSEYLNGLPSEEDVIRSFKEYLGEISTFFDYKEYVKLPRGSEGSLRYNVRIDNYSGYNSFVVIDIYGDLRDYSSQKQIIKWFTETFDETKLGEEANILPYINNAILTVENEYSDEKSVVVWKNDKTYQVIKIDKTDTI